jgi:hypothetical protein
LDVTDRIRLWICLEEAPSQAIKPWEAHIAAQVLATEIHIVTPASEQSDHEGTFSSAGELSDSSKLRIWLGRA